MLVTSFSRTETEWHCNNVQFAFKYSLQKNKKILPQNYAAKSNVNKIQKVRLCFLNYKDKFTVSGIENCKQNIHMDEETSDCLTVRLGKL